MADQPVSDLALLRIIARTEKVGQIRIFKRFESERRRGLASGSRSS